MTCIIFSLFFSCSPFVTSLWPIGPITGVASFYLIFYPSQFLWHQKKKRCIFNITIHFSIERTVRRMIFRNSFVNCWKAFVSEQVQVATNLSFVYVEAWWSFFYGFKFFLSIMIEYLCPPSFFSLSLKLLTPFIFLIILYHEFSIKDMTMGKHECMICGCSALFFTFRHTVTWSELSLT